jgi:protein-tyrosine kinase
MEKQMDLRKSIEKAKQMREGVQQELTEETLPGTQPNNGDSWMSPTYSESSTVQLDQDILVKNRVLSAASEMNQIESYKVLRAQILQRTREEGWRTIMITSPNPGEGKTLTTINLGITFAKEFNQTVLLVDADLRRQKMHRYLGISSDFGLVDHLIDNRPLSDLILWPGIEQLTLISGGKCIRDSSEHLGSPKMKHLVTGMKERYKDRYILFDAPPILTGADTIAFAPHVDCILMVVESERTGTKDVKKALELIPREKFLGFVLNRYKYENKAYYY